MFDHTDEKFRKDFGAYLRHLRTSSDRPISQDALAVHIGVSYKTIARIENGDAVREDTQNQFEKLLMIAGGPSATAEFGRWRDETAFEAELPPKKSGAEDDLGELPVPEHSPASFNVQPEDSQRHLQNDSSTGRDLPLDRKDTEVLHLATNPIASIGFMVFSCGLFVSIIANKASIFPDGKYLAITYVLYMVVFSTFSVSLLIMSLSQWKRAVKLGFLSLSCVIFSCAMYLVFPFFVFLFFFILALKNI